MNARVSWDVGHQLHHPVLCNDCTNYSLLILPFNSLMEVAHPVTADMNSTNDATIDNITLTGRLDDIELGVGF